MPDLVWDHRDQGDGLTIHRARLEGETVAAIFRQGDHARIVAAHLDVTVSGDTLDDNKRTAGDMLAAPTA